MDNKQLIESLQYYTYKMYENDYTTFDVYWAANKGLDKRRDALWDAEDAETKKLRDKERKEKIYIRNAKELVDAETKKLRDRAEGAYNIRDILYNFLKNEYKYLGLPANWGSIDKLRKDLSSKLPRFKTEAIIAMGNCNSKVIKLGPDAHNKKEFDIAFKAFSRFQIAKYIVDGKWSTTKLEGPGHARWGRDAYSIAETQREADLIMKKAIQIYKDMESGRF